MAATSLTCDGNGIELARIFSAAENGTRLTTNSSVARMLRHVSLGCVGEFRPTPIPTVAGAVPNTLKKENGAALSSPFLSWEVTHAIGRGNTVASISLYRISSLRLSKSNFICNLPCGLRNVSRRWTERRPAILENLRSVRLRSGMMTVAFGVGLADFTR